MVEAERARADAAIAYERAETARRVSERDDLHREHLERCLAQAASERSLLLERVDSAECRAEQATAALNDLVNRILSVIPAPQPAEPWWARWLGGSRRSDLRR